MPAASHPSFETTNASVTKAALELHHALRDALERALPSLDGARACGRALGLKRHLGWQIYAIGRTTDHATVIRSLPKARGWKLVLESLGKHGCPDKQLRVLREAIRHLDAELGAGRAHLPSMRAVAAGALDTATQRSAMLRARAEARRGNEFLHGIGVRTYLSALLIGPVAPDGAVGMAAATSIHGIRRTRPGGPWPIYYTLETHDDQHPTKRVASVNHRKGTIGPLVRNLSSATAGSGCLRVHRDGETRMVELLDRGAANEEPLDVAFVEHVAKAGTLRVASNRWKLMFLMTTPTERTVTEVWFHRSIRLVNDPAAMLMSSPNLNRRVLAEHGLERLPLEATTVSIQHPTLPATLRRHSAVHGELLALAARRLGAPIDEFTGFQLDVANPPWMSMLAMSFDC
jgi:hypothetical protein